MVFSNRTKSFWYSVIGAMIIGSIIILFVFLPIFSLPLTDDPSGTAIKRSLYEQVLIENFGIEP